MPRRFLKRILPKRAELQGRWFLRPFSALLHDPALWATHRKNVLKALGLGIFVAFLPIPGQTVLAVAVALWLRVNLAVAAVASWLANPLTIPPIYYACYRLGSWLLNTPPREMNFELSFQWLSAELGRAWPPLILGCIVLGGVVATGSVLVLNQVWIRSSRSQFAQRHRRQRTG
ncbi:MAG: DUF2062 domain-containing protein [Gammaproteobacteria bacterium]